MYNLYKDEKEIGLSLSKGELNQWLLDLDLELDELDSDVFKADLGYTHGDFEDFLYNSSLNIPLCAKFSESTIQITHSDL